MANFIGGTKKSHRDRKSPGSAEVWRKQKKERNAARGKQVWMPKTTNGFFEAAWVRIPVV